jgi:hypothetical protein
MASGAIGRTFHPPRLQAGPERRQRHRGGEQHLERDEQRRHRSDLREKVLP